MARKEETRVSLNKVTHTALPWKWCGEDGKHFCGHIWSADGNSHIVTVISGKWGDDYASLRFVEGSPSLHLTVEAYMDQITYGEIPEDVAKANARFIVTACNNHEQMLEALEWAYGELENPDCSREDVLEVLAKAIRQVDEQSK